MDHALQRRRILVADDDAAIVDAVQLILEDAGYEVSAATDGAVVGTVLREPPDLLLLDIWMSGASGQAICRELKANPATKRIPIVMFSANRDLAAIAASAGADGVLGKPFDLSELLDVIEKHLSPCP
jgi:CheY-like chemotaxis protein